MPSRFAVAAGLILSASLAPADDSDVGTTKKKYTLPEDTEANVIVLEYEGGFTPPRTSKEPAMAIRADGTVIIGSPFGATKRIEAKIDEERIMELLEFMLEKHEFAKYDQAKVEAAIQAEQEKSGMGIAIADAATTVIQVFVNGEKREGKAYALGFMARQYPGVKQLAQLEAIQDKLEQLRAEINAGGKEGVAKALKLANAELKRKFPDVAELTANELRSAWQQNDGTATVDFSREEKLKNGKTRFTSATINYDAAGKPQVNVDSAEVAG